MPGVNVKSLKEREYLKWYRKAYVKSVYERYLGVCTCPKCGLRGYLSRFKHVNVKTGCTHSMKYFMVTHHHDEHGKTVHDKTCYAGCSHEDLLPCVVMG